MPKKLSFVVMKNLIYLLSVLLLFSACSEDFKVGADYKEVTVVYGLLDKGITSNEQFIKITKGFYSEDEDNLLLAMNKDSIYYADLDVKIEEVSNGNVSNTFQCNKVDLATLPNPVIKRTGIFLDSPNYAYRFVANLDPNLEYRLVLKNNETGSVITGITNIINTSDQIFSVIRPFFGFGLLEFSDPSQSYNFIWKAPPGAEMFDIMLRFNYDEITISTKDTVSKSVDLALASFIPRITETMSYKVENSTFYSLLTANVGAAPSNNVVRRVDTPELFFMAGDETLKTYIDINNAQGGLTNDQIKPEFTNLSRDGVPGTVTKDVLGIFGTRATRRVGYVLFDNDTYDSISGGSATRNLNFVGRSLR